MNKAKAYKAMLYLVTGLMVGVGYLLLSCGEQTQIQPSGDDLLPKDKATAPGAPRNLVLTSTIDTITAKWQAPSELNALTNVGATLLPEEISYVLYYLEKPSSGTKTAAEVKAEATSANPAQKIEVGKGVLTATIPKLTSNAIYYVVVEAINSTDTTKSSLIASPSEQMTVPQATAPTAAPVITAQVDGEKAESQIVVHWNAISADGSKKLDGSPAALADLEVEIYYTTTNPNSNVATVITGTPAMTLAATETSTTITGLAAGTTYYVVARIVVKVDRTKYTDSTSVAAYQTLSRAAAPTTAPVITAQVDGEKTFEQIIVRWDAVSADGAKKADGSAAALADLEVAVYYTSINPNNDVATVIQRNRVMTVAATERSATITGVPTGTTYYVALRLQVKSDVTKYKDGTSVVQYQTDGTASYPLFDAWTSDGNVALYTNSFVLGQGIRDASFADDAVIATITALDADRSFTYTLGSSTGTAVADGEGKLIITKGNVKTTDAADGAHLTLNKIGGAANAAKAVATYQPSLIHTWQDLQAMRLALNISYTLEKDIVFPALNTDNFPATGFEPIGSLANKFTGTLNGNKKTITGLSIQRPTTDYVGLFGYIEGAGATSVAVENLTFHNPSAAGKERVGVLAGGLIRGIARNIAVTVDESQKNSKRVNGLHRVGGVVGLALAGGTIRGYSQIDVVASGDGAGGLVGENNTGTITGYATGQVSGGTWVGGLAGYSDGPVTGYALGDVTGKASVGGLVGVNTNAGTVVGYARGMVIRSSGANATLAPAVGESRGGTVSATYYSGRGGRYNVVDANGSPLAFSNTVGTAITMSTATAQTAFANLTFTADLWRWTWVADGKWPAFNMGTDAVGAAATANQPVDAYLSASTVAAPSFGTVTPAATTIPLTWGALSLPTDAKQANGAALTLADGVAIELYYLADAAAAKTAAEIMAGTQFSGYLDGTATTATLTGLTSGTKYHVLLRVLNKSDVSKASDVIKVYTTQ